jgi:hypothetical protein
MAFAALATCSGCALLEWIVGPSNQTLWQNDLHVAEMLTDELTGADGYYTGDQAMADDARSKAVADLQGIRDELKGPVQPSSSRRALEARLTVHAKRFPAYVDKDTALKPEEKAILKEPVEKWLERVGKGT